MTKSQYEILLEELKKVLCFVSELEIEQISPQIDVFLSESNVFGDYEEIDEPDDRHPVDILKRQLLFLTDNRELSKWNAILSLYLAKEIVKRNQQDNSKLVNYALHSINVSKSYLSKEETQSKQLKKGIKKGRSSEATESNKKRYEYLNILKKAAVDKFESAIEELQLRRRIEKKNTSENRSTYKNAAKIIYPEIAYLNKDKNGLKLIGRNGDPVGSLERILKEAASKDDLKSTRGR